MWQLSRQNISRRILGRQFHLKQVISRLKTQALLRFEPSNFAVSGVLVISMLSVQEILRKEFITKQGTTRSQMSLTNKVIYGEKVSTRLQNPCFSQG